MPVGYNQYTMASLIAEIADLNDDPTYIQWEYAETRYAVIEALRYWGALTSYWRQRGAFQSAAGQPFYDLSVQFPDLRSRTVTFNDIVTEIDYHCFELPGGVNGAGLTSQFTISQIITSIARARNRFIMDTGLPLSLPAPSPVISPPEGRFFVDQKIAYLRHGYWQDAQSGSWNVLRPVDAWTQDAGNQLWTLEPDVPFAFSQSVTRPLEVQLYPLPANPGQVRWVTVQTLNFDAVTANTLLNIPDEFAHAVKYAALSDLYTMDGESSDPKRAAYAETRYSQTVNIARLHRSVVRVQVNGVPVGLSTITGLDNSDYRWVMRGGKPCNAGCDMDLLALSPVPDDGYGISCDVLRSAPIPASDSEFLQIGREMIPIIVDYVQHYLGFKLGGIEFFGEMGGYDGFMNAAIRKSNIQEKQIKFMVPLYGTPARENVIQMGEGEGSGDTD